MMLSQDKRLLLVSAALLAFGCGPDGPAPVAAPTASASAKLEAEPTGLVESPREVFGVHMPVGTKPKTQLPDFVVVYVPYSTERVANYLRERLDGAADVGPNRTVFSGVTPRGVPDSRHLLIVVEPDGFGARVTLKRQLQ